MSGTRLGVYYRARRDEFLEWSLNILSSGQLLNLSRPLAAEGKGLGRPSLDMLYSSSRRSVWGIVRPGATLLSYRSPTWAYFADCKNLTPLWSQTKFLKNLRYLYGLVLLLERNTLVQDPSVSDLPFSRYRANSGKIRRLFIPWPFNIKTHGQRLLAQFFEGFLGKITKKCPGTRKGAQNSLPVDKMA